MKLFNLIPTVLIYAVVFCFFNIKLSAQTGSDAASRKDQASVLYQQGEDFVRNSKYGKAVKTLKQAIALNPRMPGIYIYLTLAYMGLGKGDEAIAAAHREMEVSPDSAMAYNNSGYALRLAYNQEEAIGVLKKAIELDPKLSKAYFNLADVYQSKGMLADDPQQKSEYLAAGEAVMEKLLEFQPNDEVALVKFIELIMMAGDYQKALGASRELVRIRPEGFEAQRTLGIAYLQNGSPAEAVPVLEKAAGLKPDDEKCRRFLGIALATTGQREKAIEILKSGVVNEFDVFFGLGMKAYYDGKFDDALEYFKRTVVIKPNSAEAIFQLSLSYQLTGNHQAALEQYARLKEINTEDAEELRQRINN